MEKNQKFVKDNKEIIIGGIICTGLAVAGKALYDIGVDKGMNYTNTVWLAMLNADTDRTLALRDYILSKTTLENDGNFIELGHYMLDGAMEKASL